MWILSTTNVQFEQKVWDVYSLLQGDSGVNDLVQDVADQVHDDDQAGQHDGGAHDQGVVTVGNGADESSANAGHGEDLLNNQRTGDDVGQHGAKVCDDGDQGVLQCVTEDDLHG